MKKSVAYKAVCRKCRNIQDSRLKKCSVCNADMTAAKILYRQKFSQRSEAEKIDLIKKHGFLYSRTLVAAVLILFGGLAVFFSALAFLITRKNPGQHPWDWAGIGLIITAAVLLSAYIINNFHFTPKKVRALIKKGDFENAFTAAVERIKKSKRFCAGCEISVVCLGYYLNKEIDFAGIIKRLSYLFEEQRSLWPLINNAVKEIANDIGADYCPSYFA